MARRLWLGWLALPAAGAVLVGAPVASALAAPANAGAAPLPDQGKAAPANPGTASSPATDSDSAARQQTLDALTSASGGVGDSLGGSLGALANSVGTLPDVSASQSLQQTATAQQLAGVGASATTAHEAAAARAFPQVTGATNLQAALQSGVDVGMRNLVLGALRQPVMTSPAATGTGAHLLGQIISFSTAINLLGAARGVDRPSSSTSSLGDVAASQGLSSSLSPQDLLSNAVGQLGQLNGNSSLQAGSDSIAAAGLQIADAIGQFRGSLAQGTSSLSDLRNGTNADLQKLFSDQAEQFGLIQ